MIQKLKADKLKLTAELNESKDQAIKAIELKRLADEEVNRLKLGMQTAGMDKQMLQQKVQNLTGVMELLRSTTVTSMDEFLNRLKLDLSYEQIGWKG